MFRAGGDDKKRIRQREADRFFAEVETDEASARRESRLKLGEIENGHLALADLDAVAGGIAQEEALQSFRFAFFFYRGAFETAAARAAAMSGTRKQTWRLLLGQGSGSTPMWNCSRANLKPSPAARAQFFRLGDFDETEDVSVEIEALGFERLRTVSWTWSMPVTPSGILDIPPAIPVRLPVRLMIASKAWNSYHIEVHHVR